MGRWSSSCPWHPPTWARSSASTGAPPTRSACCWRRRHSARAAGRCWRSRSSVEIVLGTLVKPLGLTGELKLQESEDFWAAALDSAKLCLRRGAELRPVRIEGARTHSAGMQALRLAGVTRREEAQAYVGQVVATAGGG